MERFEFVANLGEGAYGTVWLCLDRETGQRVAMKRFKDAHTDEEVMRLALREIRMLKSCSHKNVVRLNEAFRSKSGRVYMVLEYVPRTLTEELRAHPRGFPTEKVKLYTYQLLQAAAYMHRSRLLHRDLKPANILISEAEEIKLCDFGFARMMVGRSEAEYTTYVVTRWYRAPEIIVNDAYGPAVDIWAIGCLFSEMACGRPLFPGRNSFDQLWLTMRCLGQLPHRHVALMRADPKLSALNVPAPEELVTLEKRFPEFTPEMMQLLRGCLALDPAQRLTAEQALELPYFDDVQPLLGVVDVRKAKLQERLAQEAALVRAAAAAGGPITAAAVAAAAAPGNTAPQFMTANTQAYMAAQQGVSAAYGTRPVHMPGAPLGSAAGGWMRSQAEAAGPSVMAPFAAAAMAPSGRPPIAPLPPHVAALAAAAAAQAQQRMQQEQQLQEQQRREQELRQRQAAVEADKEAAAALHTSALQQPSAGDSGSASTSSTSCAPGSNGVQTPNAHVKRTRSQSLKGPAGAVHGVERCDSGEPAAQRGRQSEHAEAGAAVQGVASMQVDGSEACLQPQQQQAVGAEASKLHSHGSPVSVLPDGLESASSSVAPPVHPAAVAAGSSKAALSRSLGSMQIASAAAAAAPAVSTISAQAQHSEQLLWAHTQPHLQQEGLIRLGGTAHAAAMAIASCGAYSSAGALPLSAGATNTPWSGHTDMAVHVRQTLRNDSSAQQAQSRTPSSLLSTVEAAAGVSAAARCNGARQSTDSALAAVAAAHRASQQQQGAHVEIPVGQHQHVLASMGSTTSRRKSIGEAMRSLGHKLEALITRPFGPTQGSAAQPGASGQDMPHLAGASGKSLAQAQSVPTAVTGGDSLRCLPAMPLSGGSTGVLVNAARASNAGSL